MARTICSIFLILFALEISGRKIASSDDYVLLIMSIRDYYHSNCVIFAYSDVHDDLNVTTVIQAWTHQLSRREILSVAVTFPQLPDYFAKYQKRIRRPLVVILLTTNETLDQFAKAVDHIDVSFPVWFVIFFPYPGNLLEDFCESPTGNRFNLAFNTEMLVICYHNEKLREWYAIRENRTLVSDFATWNPETGFVPGTNMSLYARRNNLFGETLRVTYVGDSPFVTFKDGLLSNLFGSVVEELSHTINFKIDVQGSIPAYGSWNKEERVWTGVIGHVVANKADFGIAEFTITKHRLDAIDFTLPLILSPNRLYFKRPDNNGIQWGGHLKAFQRKIWIMIVLIIVTVPILLAFMKTRSCVTMKQINDSYIHVWGIFCQQGLSELPNEFSLRISFLSLFVTALIVSSAYSASLISFLTVTAINLPFSTIDEFAKDGSYKLIVFRNSADYDMFLNASDGIFFMMKKMLKEKQELPVSLSEGFNQVCSEKVAFYTTEALTAGETIPCDIGFIETGRIDSLALILAEKSPYRGVINFYLQHYKDNGILNKLKATYTLTVSRSESSYRPVAIWGTVPVLVMLAAGTGLGCFILILEKIYFRYTEVKNKEDVVPVKKLNLTDRSKPRETRKMRQSGVKFSKKNTLSLTKPVVGYWP